MSTFKITNITNFLGKRDVKSNSILDITYVDNMTKKTITVKPNESIYLTISSLPLSVHRLRVKNLITVSEVSEAELATLQSKVKKIVSTTLKTPKPMKTIDAEVKVDEDAEDMYSTSKRTKTKKKETEE